MGLVFGIVGTLLGVIVGAFLTRWIDFHYERRREVRQAISSALILREELEDAEAGLEVIAESKEGVRLFLFAGLPAWGDHREILLSAGMPHRDWTYIAMTFRHLSEIVPVLQNPELEWIPSVAKAVSEMREDCAKGIRLLSPFIVEAPVPFFSPESIFDTSST